ncbi:MAG: hypothetical protein H0V56_12100 [Chthoniobacterales bacterium]|nr:hypothetical protein [Chthoniobacterales bacterium]
MRTTAIVSSPPARVPVPRCARAAQQCYQSTELHLPSGSSAAGREQARAFRSISETFLREETKAEAQRELLLFGIVIAICSWPVAVAIKVAVAMATW